MTVAALGIQAFDTLQLHTVKAPDEDDVLFASDVDVDGVKDEGSYNAFSGTLLSGGGSRATVGNKTGSEIPSAQPSLRTSLEPNALDEEDHVGK